MLRDLLNRNARISIPEAETQFIPYFVKKYGNRPSFQDQRERFDSFCDEFGRSTFFRYMRERGYAFDAGTLAKKSDLNEWASIFEQLLRSFGPRPTDPKTIFGDKTPDYVKAMKLLKGIFPAARFVHIIRDPRDCCVSAFKAWGLHPYGMAQRWTETLERERRVGRSLDSYMEVRYEDLITDAESTLRGVCRFVGCDFVSEMLSLSRSNENAGDARGATEILSGNMNKFWDVFPKRIIRRIEEITFDQMIELGYEPQLARGPKPLKGAVRTLFMKRNAVSFLRHKARTRGWKSTATDLATRPMRRF